MGRNSASGATGSSAQVQVIRKERRAASLRLQGSGSRWFVNIMVKILLVFGTRPEVIKMAPVALALRDRSDEFETVLCSTGQHRDMLNQTLAVFGLEPNFNLDLMEPRQTLADLTARAVGALDKVMTHVRPDLVVVQGDTTSAMVGALVAYYNRVPVAHVEAGLRTGDLFQPFPEEGNRRLISTLAALHFAPTSTAAYRLQQEGVPEDRTFITGNTVIDALLRVLDGGRQGAYPVLPRGRRRILLTMHRRESRGEALESICRTILQLVERNPDIEVVFPVHASPFVREPVTRLLSSHARIILTEPLGYQEFVLLMDSCQIILTDSGGIQEEAPALGKPVLVLRDTTERPEAIRAGTARLLGTDPTRVLSVTETLLRDEKAYQAMAFASNPYGDGRAVERIVAALRFHFGLLEERPAPFAPYLASRRSDEGAA
jgi:UDP-N-acetylglucosamine 2-epimerase (non-hydrolysing)